MIHNRKYCLTLKPLEPKTILCGWSKIPNLRPQKAYAVFCPVLEITSLKRLRWKYIILIVDHLQPFVAEAFSDATAKEDICITMNLNVNTNT